MSNVYVDYPIVTDADQLAGDAIAYLQSIFPGWIPNAGNLDTIMLEAISRIASETATVASNVPISIYRYLGKNIFKLPAQDATSAIAQTTWVAQDNLGHTIDDGSQLAVRDNFGNLMPFQVVGQWVIPAGTTTLAGVNIVAVDPGAASSGLGAPGTIVTLIDTYEWIATNGVTLAAMTSGGADAETDAEYMDRFTTLLGLMAPRPILPADFAAMYQNIVGVDRAVAVDLYTPVNNMLTAQQSSLEDTTTTGWEVDVNTALTNTNAWAADGTRALRLTSAAAGSQAARTLQGVAGVQVTGGLYVNAQATVRPSVARTCQLFIRAYDSGGALLATITGTAVAVAATTPTVITAAGQLPQTAARAAVVVQEQATAAAGETLDVDKVALTDGTVTTWIIGGTTPYNQPRNVSLAAMDSTGAPVPSPVKANGQAYLQSLREVGFVVNMIDPILSPISVTVNIYVYKGYVAADVRLQVISAIQSYLNSANWGLPPGDAPGWVNDPVVRYLKLSQVIENVPGVHYISTTAGNYDLTIAIQGNTLARQDIIMPGVVPLPQAGTITVTTVQE